MCEILAVAQLARGGGGRTGDPCARLQGGMAICAGVRAQLHAVDSTACTSSSWCRRRGAAGGRGGALGGRRRLVERAPRLGRRRRGRERRVDALCSVGDGVDNEPSLMSFIETAFAPAGLCRWAGSAFR